MKDMNDIGKCPIEWTKEEIEEDITALEEFALRVKNEEEYLSEESINICECK